MTALRLYDYGPSANCYKARLLLAQLGTDYERVSVGIFDGHTLTDDFARLNPHRSTPVLQLPDGRTLVESNAILWHLASGTPYLPADSFAQAEVCRWLIYEQTDVMFMIGGLRFRLITGRWTPDEPEARRRHTGAARGAPHPRPAPRGPDVPRRRPVLDRRHRRLRVFARRRGGGRRSVRLSQLPRLARPHPRAAALRRRLEPYPPNAAMLTGKSIYG